MSDPQIEKQERHSPFRKKMKEQGEQEAFDLVSELSVQGSVEIKVIRTAPTEWPPTGPNRMPCAGHVCSFDEPVTEDQIKTVTGGGFYKLEVYTPDERGKMKLFTEKVIKFPGPPNVDAVPTPVQVAPAVPEGTKEAMRMAERMVTSADERARRAEESRREDPAVQLMADQLSAMREAMERKDDQIHAFMREASKPRDEHRSADRILEKFVDGESARITALISQHESEVRSLRDQHRADLDRVQDRLDKTLERQEDAHKREVDSMRRASDQQLMVTTTVNTTLLEGYKHQVSSLERELTAAKVELAELRAQKNKGPIDSLNEMVALKNAFSELSPQAETEQGSTVERIISGVLGSPIMEGIAARVAHGPGGPPPAGPPPIAQPTGPQDLPVNQPVTLADGRILTRKPDNRVIEQLPNGTAHVHHPDGKVTRLKRRAGAPAAGPPLDPEVVRQAVMFMEGAVRNQTDPETFAASAKSMVPDSVINALRAKGVDAFLSDVAGLEAGSPLYTIAGKAWVRKVASILLGEE